jgi:large subunit ribosomal protein L25
MPELLLEAQPREGRGSNRARQMRRGGQIPGVVYGGTLAPIAVRVDPRAVEKILHSEAGYNAVFTLEIPGQGKTPAMIKDWQYEPVKGSLLHVDFLRIALDTRIKVKVPVHTSGEAKGVKQQGGVLEIVQRELEVECLPGDIPDEFKVDVSELAIAQGIRVGDLKVDNRKVRILTDPERVVVHVVAPRVEEEAKPAEAAAVVEAAPAEPEVIRKGKAEEAAAVEAEAEAEDRKKEK